LVIAVFKQSILDCARQSSIGGSFGGAGLPQAIGAALLPSADLQTRDAYFGRDRTLLASAAALAASSAPPAAFRC